MEIAVIIIMLLVGFSFLLKLTALPLVGRIAVCAVCALFVVMTREYAISQSKTQITAWVQSPELMLDVAVLLTVDVFIQVAFCILSGRRIFGEQLSRWENLAYQATRWIPGILIFPTLFAVLTEVIFTFTGTDFATIAWTLAAVVFAAGMILPHLLAVLLPEKDLRVEVIFMLNALIALLGIVATVNGRTAVAGVNSANWRTLAAVMALLIACAGCGFILFKRKQNKLNTPK